MEVRDARLRVLRDDCPTSRLDPSCDATEISAYLRLSDDFNMETQPVPDWSEGCLSHLKHRDHSHLVFTAGSTILSSMFAITTEFHWPWKVGDEYLKSQFPSKAGKSSNVITSVLAATASGKTGLSFRALSSNFGMYLTCTHSIEAREFGHFCDAQMASLHRILSSLPQEILLLSGLSYFQLSMIARLYVLIQRTTTFFSAQERLPSPKEFLAWQVNGATTMMTDAFLQLTDTSLLFENEDTLGTKMRNLYTELIKLLGVASLPLFIDEANILALPLSQDRVVLTANGTVRPDGLLSLMLQSLTGQAPWGKVPIVLTGTGFTTEVSRIIQSSGFSQSEKTNPRMICELIGHPLIRTSEEALKCLKAIIKVPNELERCINSPEFKFYLPMRRRLLVVFLREWWTVYKWASVLPTSVDLIDKMKWTYEDSIKSQVLDLEKRAKRCGNESKMLRALGVARFLSVNQSDSVSLFGKESFLHVIIRESPKLYHEFMSTGFCSYNLSNKSFTRTLEKGKPPSGEIYFNLQEPAAQDTLSGLLGKLDHTLSLGYLVDDICDRYQLVPLSERDKKFASNHFELLSCFVIQSLFAKHSHPRLWSFIQRQTENLPEEGFFSSGDLGPFHGVIVGERSLVHLLKKNAVPNEQDLIKVDKIVNGLQTHNQLSKKLQKESQSSGLLVLPRTDRIIALVLQNDLHHLIEGYLIFPSEDLRPDAIGIMKVSDEIALNERYGLVISSTKRLTSEDEEKLQDSFQHNTFQTDRTRTYLSQSRVEKWVNIKNLITVTSKNDLLLEISRGADDIWQRCFRSRWNSQFPQSAWMKCTTSDNQVVEFLNEEYACSVFDAQLQTQNGITMRNYLNSFKYCLPVAVLLHHHFSDCETDQSMVLSEEQQNQQTIYQFGLDDLIELHPGAEVLRPFLKPASV